MELDEMNKLAEEGHSLVERLNDFLDRLEEEIAKETKKEKEARNNAG